MPYATINQLPVSSGQLTLPTKGRGVAVFLLALDLNEIPFAVNDTATLEFDDGTQYILSVRRVQPKGGFWECVLVQGKNKLGQVLRPKFYEGITLENALKDAISEAGETVGGVSAPGVLPRFMRRGESLIEVLSALLGARAESWWFDKAGAINIGVPSWAQQSLTVSAFESRVVERRWLLPNLPDLEPRITLEIDYAGDFYTQKIDRVIHTVGHQLRTMVTWQSDFGHVQALERLTQDSRLDYALLYPSKILKDYGDNHFDLQPDDATLPALTRVPWRSFVPGVSLQVAPNARALLGFESGDSTKPVLLEFENGAIKNLKLPTSIKLELGGTENKGVARVQDSIEVTLYLAPDLVPKIMTMPGFYIDPILGPLPLVPLQVTGKITSGSSIVKAVD